MIHSYLNTALDAGNNYKNGIHQQILENLDLVMFNSLYCILIPSKLLWVKESCLEISQQIQVKTLKS